MSDEPVKGVKCWTFILRGGHTFSLMMDGRLGPGHDHDGRMTIWKFVGTADEADEVESTLLREIPELRIEKHTEIEDDEMLALRRERLGQGPPGE